MSVPHFASHEAVVSMRQYQTLHVGDNDVRYSISTANLIFFSWNVWSFHSLLVIGIATIYLRRCAVMAACYLTEWYSFSCRSLTIRNLCISVFMSVYMITLYNVCTDKAKKSRLGVLFTLTYVARVSLTIHINIPEACLRPLRIYSDKME